MSFTIRKVSVEDAYEYALCHTACWLDAYAGLVPDEYLKNMHNEQVRRAEKNREVFKEPGDNEYYCAEYEGKMVGRLVFGKCRDEDKTAAGEIHAIYLIAEHWGKGYGRQMLEFALSRLKQNGYREIVIWMFAGNDRAKAFYEKHGFKPDGRKNTIKIGKPLAIARYVR